MVGSVADMTTVSAICRKCGRKYSKLRGNFQVSYAAMYKGTGYLPYCRDCVDSVYNAYFDETHDARISVRSACRKFDIYWNDKIFDSVDMKSTPMSMMTNYMSKTNNVKYAGKSYDDTLREEGTMWIFPSTSVFKADTPELPDGSSRSARFKTRQEANSEDSALGSDAATRVGAQNNNDVDSPIEVDVGDEFVLTDEIVEFWGPGYTPNMYKALAQRWDMWLSKLPDGIDLDVGTEICLRQICSLELDIIRDRAAGRPVDKNMGLLNQYIGSMNWKPAQKKADENDSGLTDTPMGVWLYKFENEKPLPEVDDDLKDVNKIRKYVIVWVLGHLAKMLGLKNQYSEMYEEEISRLKVEHPEYEDDETDSELMSDIFGEDDSDE